MIKLPPHNKLINGDIFFIYPNKLPETPPPGYTQDSKNKQLFRMQQLPCKFKTKEKCGVCAKPVIKVRCKKGYKLDCPNCPDRQE